MTARVGEITDVVASVGTFPGYKSFLELTVEDLRKVCSYIYLCHDTYDQRCHSLTNFKSDTVWHVAHPLHF